MFPAKKMKLSNRSIHKVTLRCSLFAAMIENWRGIFAAVQDGLKMLLCSSIQRVREVWIVVLEGDSHGVVADLT